MSLEAKTEALISSINALHDSCARAHWGELKQDAFVFELEQSTARLKEIYLVFDEVNRESKMLLEKNAPNLDALLVELHREITVLEANVSMEKKKDLKHAVINERDLRETPDLYSSLQQKILSITIKMLHAAGTLQKFSAARKMPFVKKGSTARDLLEALKQKEEELTAARQRSSELKRKAYFGLEEQSIADTESLLNEEDQKLSEALSETRKSLKTHFAQLSYIEGSFADLRSKVEALEQKHSAFAQKSKELIKGLKKERDYAKTFALEIEKETLQSRNEYTKHIVEMEEKKQGIEETLREKHEKNSTAIQKQLEEKEHALRNAHKLIEKLEKEVSELKQKN